MLNVLLFSGTEVYVVCPNADGITECLAFLSGIFGPAVNSLEIEVGREEEEAVAKLPIDCVIGVENDIV